MYGIVNVYSVYGATWLVNATRDSVILIDLSLANVGGKSSNFNIIKDIIGLYK
jgi:hypothetical protein